jgi:hypothetical protein
LSEPTIDPEVARRMIESQLELGDDSQASTDAIRVMHALAFGGREALREVVNEIIQEGK